MTDYSEPLSNLMTDYYRMTGKLAAGRLEDGLRTLDIMLCKLLTARESVLQKIEERGGK